MADECFETSTFRMIVIRLREHIITPVPATGSPLFRSYHGFSTTARRDMLEGIVHGAREGMKQDNQARNG
jgi:hypothetical protein